MKRMALDTALQFEDDGDGRNVVQIGLNTPHGIKVTGCDAGQRGWMIASDDLADLLLLDKMMPDIDGPRVREGQRPRAIHRDAPAIFLTASEASRSAKNDSANWKFLSLHSFANKQESMQISMRNS